MTLFIQCSNDNGIGGSVGNWLVPQDQVFDGGPGKDGIPSIDNPIFDVPQNIDFVGSLDLVIASKLDDQVYIYPHSILDWHEIVNHLDPNEKLALTYCPLTGTGIGWNPIIDGQVTEFGVSGLLYNSNLIPYDRSTDSNWSQMRLDCVNGERIGTNIELIHIVESNYGTILEMYPDAQVLTTNTGFSRNYSVYPYGGYRTNSQLIFPIDGELNSTLAPKERILGVQVGSETTGFTFDNFAGSGSSVVSTSIGGRSIAVIGSEEDNYMVAFESVLEGTPVTLSGLSTSGEAIATDSQGNSYNVFGEVISGPDAGKRLNQVTNYIGYWFAWAAFADDIELF